MIEVVQGLLVAIGRAIAWLKQRDERPKLLFNEVIEPLFDTEKVPSNYNVIFQRLLSAISNNDEEAILSAVSKFREDRMELNIAVEIVHNDDGAGRSRQSEC